MFDYSKLPKHMQSGAQLYIEKGSMPGDFLTAVLENDLTGAFHRADRINKEVIQTWVEWLHWEIPSVAWGSPKLVRQWVIDGGLEGRNKDE